MQNNAEQCRAEQSMVEQNKVEQSKVEQSNQIFCPPLNALNLNSFVCPQDLVKIQNMRKSFTKNKRAKAVVNILFKKRDVSTNYLSHCQSVNNAQEKLEQ